jgi:hypothetical protein
MQSKKKKDISAQSIFFFQNKSLTVELIFFKGKNKR